MSKETPDWLQHARDHWEHRGVERPSFADEPGPGQESVWDYPRPPAIAPDGRSVKVALNGELVAHTTASVRVLETSSPPAFYLSPEAVLEGRLVPVPGSSHCEWKGEAQYLAVAGTADPIGWCYPKPYEFFAQFAGWVSFYPGRIDCTVDGENVRAQSGGFYGGWITDELVGPFKGDPGTSDW